jgi:3-methyladenine DNA glycosylase Tag
MAGSGFLTLRANADFPQAVGMVNDHLVDCFRYREIRQD